MANGGDPSGIRLSTRGQPGNRPDEKHLLKRDLRTGDLTLFYVAGALSVRWIATAAAAGPSTVLIWLFACAFFFVPLAASVLQLSARYPQEGGLYIWTERAFGPFAGFLAAWTYWMSNLPYFPAVLYFGAGSLLFAFPHGQRLAGSSGYYLAFALLALTLITALNIRGLRFGKWLNNLGAFGSWIPVLLLLVLAAVSAAHHGSATHFTARGLVPHLSLRNAIFWSTIFFAFGGCETGSFMSEEVRDPRRTIPRALIASGGVLAVSYIAGTVSMLVALPAADINGLGGFANAIQVLCHRLGIPALLAVVAILIAVSSIGGAAAFLSSTSRLPFVAGIDRHLPAAFGRVHPRWGTPWVAIAIYGAAGALCAVLSQAGTGVQSAYDVLVSMSIITYFIPFVFLFLSMMRLAGKPASHNSSRSGRRHLLSSTLALTGLLTTLLTIVLALVPQPDEPHKLLATVKIIGSTVVLVASGAAVFAYGQHRKRTPIRPAEAS